MKKITFVTGNENKVREAEGILGFQLDHQQLSVDEVQDLQVEYVVQRKAEFAFNKLGLPLFVEDVGVYVHAWGGFPGAFIKFIEDGVGYDRFMKWLLLENSQKCTVRAALAYHDGEAIHSFVGEVNGTLVKPRGHNGFGFDAIFETEGEKKTYGEMNSEEKNTVSHRRKVYEKFKEFLENQDEK